MILLNFIVIFGCAAGVFPYTSLWSLSKKQKFRYEVVKIYTLFMLTYNAASNLDINLQVLSLASSDLSIWLYRAAVVNVGYFADFWIRSYVLFHQRRILFVLRRLCLIESIASKTYTESEDHGDGNRSRKLFFSFVFILVVIALVQETVSSYFAWKFFETKAIFLRILPRIAGAIQLTVTLNNISRGSSLAFAFALPLVVLLQCTKCYSILVNQLWTSGRSNAGWKWKMRKHSWLISILKGCLVELNELNFGLLLPHVLAHATTAANVPFAIVTRAAERGTYSLLFCNSAAFLVFVALCGRFVTLEV